MGDSRRSSVPLFEAHPKYPDSSVSAFEHQVRSSRNLKVVAHECCFEQWDPARWNHTLGQLQPECPWEDTTPPNAKPGLRYARETLSLVSCAKRSMTR